MVYVKAFNDIRNASATASYRVWRGILQRTITDKRTNSYSDSSICQEWLLFSNFDSWYQSNHKLGFDIDKDLLHEGNKVYSPSTCIFVPRRINNLFLARRSGVTSGLPEGVSKKPKGRYCARIRKDAVQIHLGYFDTPAEASYVYKLAVYEHTRNVVEEEHKKGNIDSNLFEILMRRIEERNL